MRGQVHKRDRNSWAVFVCLGRDPATKKDRRKWYSHKTRREAEAHLAHLVAHLHGGGILPSPKVRVAEYLERRLRDYVEIRTFRR